ncbi:two component transcriptional regulator, LuxR family [Frankia casuarinae]|uniref:Two component transcriptional regulator, LuxR family n=1 Tax=Frankia casuarinae (strain DSM 45818 / CECT 9043 / HFP020203 / CcI3) TaxID=106370 RepID=Q2JGW4_FRACC|nr:MULTISPECIES: response regulator transcription factor [Frankia]ABD09478.1 two component transcriptional regulator, LuxR family [Frankia casuarinae]ETA02810.1 two component transcriptional regulator, LuxR family [Frankia sp. CcI6]EYT94117.1 two component transcriptional regulator, LuxR family [Frankia casuarinae]KEZ35886.1 two component transcriptional regulator, LuxR family [Frankia sp. CeD]KFB06754.1 two component transcriptional regulator, LuxR family [Frankia sp. Allo2]
MRVAVADDSALFREGLAMLLAAAGVEVVAQAGTADEIIDQLAGNRPDAVILDIRMPPTFTDEGLIAAETIRAAHPAMGILVLSTYAETPYALRLLGDGGGGIGYLLKDRVDDITALHDALRRVVSGRLVVDEEVIAGLLAHRRRADELERLTARERAVLRHMAEGRSNQGIGAKLHLAPKTVENHVANVFTKLRMPASADDNRRVLAVLAWLRATGGEAGGEDRSSLCEERSTRLGEPR